MKVRGLYPGDINSIEMKHMKDKVFIDTNILIYFVSDDEVEKEIARACLVRFSNSNKWGLNNG